MSKVESSRKKGIGSIIGTLDRINTLDTSRMKFIFLIFFSSIFFFQAFSQTNDSIVVSENPAGRLADMIDIQDLVNKGSNDWRKEFDGHWSGVELGVNAFANPDYSQYPIEEKDFLSNDLIWSNVFNINVLQYSKGLQPTRNTIGMVTGLGLSLQSYRFDKNTSILLDDNGKLQPLSLDFDSNLKSKLSVVYLQVPLLAEFQVPFRNKINRLYCSLGINIGRRLSSHTKIKYRMGNKTEKLKSPGDYAIRDFKFAGTVRIGYQWVNLFASYDLTPMFEDSRGPVLYPFSVGVKLISF